MNMWIYDNSPYIEEYRKPPQVHIPADSSPPATFPPKLVSLLSSMPNLQEITLRAPASGSLLLETAFNETSFSLPRVKKLNIRGEGYFAIGACPNLEEIAMGGWDSTDRIIEAAGKLKGLKRIDLVGHRWNVTVSNSTYSDLVGIYVVM